MDNFPPWPSDSLRSIAEQVLANTQFGVGEILFDIVESCARINPLHNSFPSLSVRRNTPSSTEGVRYFQH